jgi:hypothetical protein
MRNEEKAKFIWAAAFTGWVLSLLVLFVIALGGPVTVEQVAAL